MQKESHSHNRGKEELTEPGPETNAELGEEHKTFKVTHTIDLCTFFPDDRYSTIRIDKER